MLLQQNYVPSSLQIYINLESRLLSFPSLIHSEINLAQQYNLGLSQISFPLIPLPHCAQVKGPSLNI